MFWGKIFTTRYDIVVAICDEELIEKEINTEKVKIKLSKNFYGEKLIDENIAINLMKKATIGNLIGKKIIDLAEENGFIVGENVIFIDDIPHAQFVKL